MYIQSGIRLVYDAYLAVVYSSVSIAFVAGLAVSFLVHALLNPQALALLAEFWVSVLYPSALLSILFLNGPLLILILLYYRGSLADRGSVYLYSFISFVITLGIGIFIHTLFFYLPFFSSFADIVFFPSVLLSAISSGVLLTVMLIYPTYQGYQDRKQIDDALVYTVGFASMLAAAGMSMERVLERIANITTNRGTRRTLSRLIRNLEVFGQDIKTAVRDVSVHSASTKLAKVMDNMLTSAQTGGELFSYLSFETKQLFLDKRDNLDRTMTNLIYLSEFYISLFVVMPVVLILMLALLSALGGGISGFSSVDMMNLLVFVGIPVAGAIFLLVLDQAIGESEF
jgi:flagellar protein FlaJ